MIRRRAMAGALALLAALPGAARAQAAALAPGKAAVPKPAAHEAALRRLEGVVRQQLGRRKSKALAFEEAVLAPQASRLVWGPGAISASRGRSWRVALDARTRWYYVLQVGADASERWFGPLDEVRSGVFEQVGAKPAT